MPINLIYHPPGATSGRVSPIDQEIDQMVRDQRIDIACPYLGLPYLERITKQSSSWRLLTDVEQWIVSQALTCRRKISAFIKKNSERVRHYPGLHAKVIIAGGTALVGSANFTEKGITKRIEMCVLFENTSEVEVLRDWFDGLWPLSDFVNSDQLLSTLIPHAPKPTVLERRYRLSSRAPRINSKLASSTKEPSAPIAKKSRKAQDRRVERSVAADDQNSVEPGAKPEATRGKPVNVGMFTAENFEKFLEKVGKADKKTGCQLWLGSTTNYTGKRGKRHFGLFRRNGCGYVMNQRMAYIMAQPANKRDTGVKVEPVPTCATFKNTGSELCCTPNHIRAQVEGTRERRAGKERAGAK